MARVAVLCEFSGKVRQAFRDLGHDAWSFDLLPAEDDSPYHIQGNVLDNDFNGWDLGICHPPCTYLCSSGALHRVVGGKHTRAMILGAVEFATSLYCLPFKAAALENPIGLLSNWKKPTQIIQPYMFGHAERKATCLWLRGVPKLEPTFPIPIEDCIQKCHLESPGPQRWAERSRTLDGVAWAMAKQWGEYIKL